MPLNNLILDLTTVEDLDLNNVTATLDSINQTEVAPPIIQSINSFQQITGKPSSVPPSPTGLPSTELVPTSTSQRQFPPVLDVTKLLPFERLLTTSNLPEKNSQFLLALVFLSLFAGVKWT